MTIGVVSTAPSGIGVLQGDLCGPGAAALTPALYSGLQGGGPGAGLGRVAGGGSAKLLKACL